MSAILSQPHWFKDERHINEPSDLSDVSQATDI